MFARRETESATTVIRTSSIEYVELWREGQLDVDFVVSSELETAYAISRILGVPAAPQTDVFADGQVQVGEFDVDDARVSAGPRRAAARRPISESSKVAAAHPPRGRRSFPEATKRSRNGDRIVVIGSPGAIKAWSAQLWPEGGTVRDVVIYGAGIASGRRSPVSCSPRGAGVRIIDASREQARRVAEALRRRVS